MSIKIENISKRIGTNEVLNNISLELDRGRIYGITGPNGSGKTMLLRAICGFIKLQEGQIIIDDVSVKFGERKQNIGLILEHPTFYPNYTGEQNLQYLASLKGNYHQEIVDELFQLFHLESMKQVKVKKYSLGMKQKLAIIQAIMENQDILLLDEPTNALDKESVQIFSDKMRELKNEGKLIVLVSHSDGLLRDICDDVLEMNAGRIE